MVSCASASCTLIFGSFCASTRSASSLAASTEASSMSCARIAVSASTVTTCGCTSRMPPEITKSSFSPPGSVTTTLPGFRRVISGACRGAMPSSPISPVATTISTSPWKISASALTMSQRMVVVMFRIPNGWAGPPTHAIPTCLRCAKAHPTLLRRNAHLLGFLDRFLDAADHVEGLFRQVVTFAVADHLEAADGLLQRDVLALRAGEHFGDGERLREKALDLARARHGLLVVFRQLVHTQDRDDVLELLILLQRR